MSHSEGTIVSYSLEAVRQGTGEVVCVHDTCIQKENPVEFLFPKV
jgi:hypothetical protein